MLTDESPHPLSSMNSTTKLVGESAPATADRWLTVSNVVKKVFIFSNESWGDLKRMPLSEEEKGEKK